MKYYCELYKDSDTTGSLQIFRVKKMEYLEKLRPFGLGHQQYQHDFLGLRTLLTRFYVRLYVFSLFYILFSHLCPLFSHFSDWIFEN